MKPAVLHSMPGSGDAPGDAWTVMAEDGVRIRVALWRARAARGTVLLFPGRSEYLEKYAPVARWLTAAGWDLAGVDWRGQGGSDRLAQPGRPRPSRAAPGLTPGHVEHFSHYQRDVAALLGVVEGLGLPRPWHLLSHSMGGCIGLAALIEGMPVTRAVFSAPMWGIRIGGLPAPVGRRVATGLARTAGRAGAAERGLPGAGSVLETAFARNPLTSDLEEYIRLMRESAAWPELKIGPPSFGWVGAALDECRRLHPLPSPGIPTLIARSGDDAVVSTRAIAERAARWPEATLLDLPGARHEPLFETPEIRGRLRSAILAHLADD